MKSHTLAAAKTFEQICFITLIITWMTANAVTSRVFLTLPDMDLFLFSTIQCMVIAVYISLRTYVADQATSITDDDIKGEDRNSLETLIAEFFKHAHFCRQDDVPTRFIVGMNWLGLGLLAWQIGMTGDSLEEAAFYSIAGNIAIFALSMANGGIVGNYVYSALRVIGNRIRVSLRHKC